VKIDWSPSTELQRAKADRLLADVQRAGDTGSVKYADADARLYFGALELRVDDARRSRIDALTASFAKNYAEACKAVLAAMDQPREAFEGVLADNENIFLGTVAHGWFRDAAAYYDCLDLKRRLLQSAPEGTKQLADAQRKRLFSAWQRALRDLRTDEFRDRLSRLAKNEAAGEEKAAPPVR
jgi:hypothetical protein